MNNQRNKPTDRPQAKVLQVEKASQEHSCTCGIPVSKARSLCTERDCPWK